MELTREEIDVIICMLNDVHDWCGLKPEEYELKEKLERWVTKND